MVTPDTGPSYRRPVFSPDGTQLLYSQGQRLFVAPTLGGVGRVIARTSGDDVRSAAWSRDGKRIAYASADTIYVRSADRDDARRLLVHPDPSMLSWSPDGRYLAFASGNSWFTTDERTPGNLAPSAILTVEVDENGTAGDVVEVADRSSLNVSPTWTPDGEYLLFLSDRDGPRDVYAVRMRSGRPRGEPRRVTSGLGAASVNISADGRRVVYSDLITRANVWSLAIPGGRVATTADARAVTTGNHLVESVTLSSDRRRLYFDSDRPGNEDVFRLSLPTGEPEQLTRHPAMDCCPHESPDGRWVAFHSSRFGTRDIFVMPAAGGEAERVTSDSTHERYPIWSPDGTMLAFRVDLRGIQVVRRSPDGGWSKPVLVDTYSNASFFVYGWTADGRVLVRRSNGGIAAVSPTTGEATRVYDPGRDSVATVGVTMTASGSVVVRSMEADGTSSFFRVMDVNRLQLIARLDDPLRPSLRPNFTTDGRSIYFVLNDNQADISVAELQRR